MFAPILLTVHAPVALTAVGAFAGGFGLAVFNTLFETTVQQKIPAEALSRVASIDWLLGLALSPVGFVVAGLAATAYGLEVPLAAAAVWIIASTALVLMVRDVRRLQRDIPETVARGPDPLATAPVPGLSDL